MRRRFCNRFFRSDSGNNLDSKIQNLKRLGLSAIAFVLVVTGAVASAQQLGKIRRIGRLSPTTAATSLSDEAFRKGLRDLGWVEGQNIAYEHRFAEGKPERLPKLAGELVRLNVDVMVAGSTPGVLAAKNATGSIPIVFVSGGDPVSMGIVASLARPGGNITGMTLQRDDLATKRLELLKEVFSKVVRVALLFNPTDASDVSILKAIRDPAQALGVTLQLVEARNASDFDGAFAIVTRERADALLCSESPLFNTHRNRIRIVDFTGSRRLPAMYGFGEFVEVGGLMSYAASLPDAYRRAASYVDKILKGAKPADLPVQQPTKFELIINLKTAKQIGLTIPPNVLARADRVIR